MSSVTTLPYAIDQLIDTALARALHADACRDHAAVARTVFWDLPAYPERYAARLATSTASPYLLLADTLVGIQEMLPPGLVRSEQMPGDPPEVVEIWFIPLASWPSKSYQAGGVIGLIEPPIAEVTHANCYFCSRVNAGSGACCLRPNGSRKLRRRIASGKFAGRYVVLGSRC
jgi:hypothetical protein